MNRSGQKSKRGRSLANGWFLSAALLVMLLATGLRFHELDAQSFWNDEGNSARLSERSLPLIIEGTASDIHPPLYYLALRGWRELVGDSEFALRSFSSYAGILTVAATLSLSRYLYARSSRKGKITVAVLSAGSLAAINPTLVYYSQEARMYSLLALLGVLSTLILLHWLNRGRPRPLTLAYISLTVAGLYTHYFYPAVLVLQGLIVLLWLMRRQITLIFDPLQLTAEPKWIRTPLNWLAAVGISFLLYTPWMPVFFRQVGGRAAERASLPDFLWQTTRWMVFGETIDDAELIWASLLVLLLLLWAIWIGGRTAVIPLLGVLVPVTFMYIAGATDPAFYKFLLPAVPFLVVWIALSVAPNQHSAAFRLVSGTFIVVTVAGMLVSLDNLYNDDTFARADYRGIAARIAEEDDGKTGVILNAPNQWEVFTYYHRQGAPVYPLPKGQPDPGILEPQLADISQRHERLYVLYWGENQQDPQHVVERWLDSNAFRTSETWIGDVRLAVYAVPAATSDVPAASLAASFEDKITLHGYTLAKDKVVPGDIIPVTLYWSADMPLDERFKVFLHFVDDTGAIVAQQDGEPVGGTSPTTTWEQNQIVVDNHGILLPDDLASGEYELLAGLYQLGGAGRRLQVRTADKAADHVLLGRISVE